MVKNIGKMAILGQKRQRPTVPIDRRYSYGKRGALEIFSCAAQRFVAKRIFVKSKQIYF
jgi:hypothetical protein